QGQRQFLTQAQKFLDRMNSISSGFTGIRNAAWASSLFDDLLILKKSCQSCLKTLSQCFCTLI
ncbi:MAG: hypothetical protein ACRD82_15460, partial [Blastocatellia bacterium]